MTITENIETKEDALSLINILRKHFNLNNGDILTYESSNINKSFRKIQSIMSLSSDDFEKYVFVPSETGNVYYHGRKNGISWYKFWNMNLTNYGGIQISKGSTNYKAIGQGLTNAQDNKFDHHESFGAKADPSIYSITTAFGDYYISGITSKEYYYGILSNDTTYNSNSYTFRPCFKI